MRANDQEIATEIEGLRSSDLQNVKQAFNNLKELLGSATSEGKEEINKALTWARSVHGKDLD